MRGNERTAVLFAFILLIVAPLEAQTGASIAGRVVDPQGLGVPGAIVTLYARSTGTRMSVTTNSEGSYRFDRLVSGDYLVEAQAPGFATTTGKPARVGRAGEATLDISLQLQGVRQDIVVTAAQAPQSADEVSKAITVVRQKELEERDELAIPEALRHVPGLRVQQLGGPGAFVSVKTRGLRNEDTAVLIDGLRFRDVGAPQGDASGFLSDFIVTDIDRLEVLRGSGSSLYGSNAIGGVINIVTDEGGGRLRGSALAEGGSLGLFRGSMRAAGGSQGDRIQYSAGAAHLNVTDGIDGDDAARKTSGQGRIGFRLSPTATLSGRVYAAHSYQKLNTSPQTLGTLPPSGIITAVPLSIDELQRYESGVPISGLNVGGANFIPAANNPDWTRDGHFFSGALFFASRPTENFGYTVTYQGLNTDRSFLDGPGGVSSQPAGNTRTDTIGVIHTLNARTNLRIGSFHYVDAGYEFESENYRNRSFPVNPATNSSVDVTQRSNALFVQDQARLLDDRLQLLLSFRTLFFSLDRPEFVPAGSSTYPGPDFAAPPNAYTGDGSIAYFFRKTGTKLRGHVGNGYRAPSLYERFGTSFSSFGYSIFGDPRLRPDRSIAFDAGIDQALFDNRLRTSTTYFYTRLQEVIIFDFSGAISPVTDPFGRVGGYRNNQGGLARGLEWSLSTAATRSLDLGIAYTHTNADQRAPVVPGIIRSFAIPDHQFSMIATQRIGRRLFVNFDLALSSSYLAPVFDPITFASRAYEFDGIAKADVVTSYRIPLSDLKGIRLYGKVENLFNRDYYENGFRTPGATALGGLQFEF
jgi:vitamin B12 transporter